MARAVPVAGPHPFGGWTGAGNVYAIMPTNAELPDHGAPTAAAPGRPMKTTPPRSKASITAGVTFLGSLAALILLGITVNVFPGTIPAGVAQALGLLLLVLLLGSVVVMVATGQQHSRRIAAFVNRPGWTAVPEPAAAVRAVRDLTFLSNEIVAEDKAYPRALLVDAVLARPCGTARVAIPPGFYRGKHQNQISLAYIWVDLRRALPTLVLRTDLPVARTVAPDVDVENEQFNREFRVSRAPSAAAADGVVLDKGRFTRYAVGVLHPRAVEVLLKPQRGRIAIGIRGRLLFATALPDAESIESLADLLLELAPMIPRHVYDDFGR